MVDEAQCLYDATEASNRRFWGGVKQLLQGGAAGMILAAAYGSRRNGDIDLTPSYNSIPVQIEPTMVVSIFPAEPGRVSLILSAQEWEDLIERYAKVTGLELNEIMRDYYFALCGGQVGLLTMCLDYINDTLKTNQRKPKVVNSHAR
eukprot:TRINITY_DN2244_c0_g1_i4.p1 TRINITY_DN2244_c0_g1~~TRINITY_DN2244_c0_g1_i4.p1  ORF type:complete len:154 (-),score=24.40 TRINITY_DN2244_c0_g1_i4:3248-3688(-)